MGGCQATSRGHQKQIRHEPHDLHHLGDQGIGQTTHTHKETHITLFTYTDEGETRVHTHKGGFGRKVQLNLLHDEEPEAKPLETSV